MLNMAHRRPGSYRRAQQTRGISQAEECYSGATVRRRAIETGKNLSFSLEDYRQKTGVTL